MMSMLSWKCSFSCPAAAAHSETAAGSRPADRLLQGLHGRRPFGRQVASSRAQRDVAVPFVLENW